MTNRISLIKNFAVILSALVFCSSCYGKDNYFNYKTVKFKDEIHRFSFPIFTNLPDKYSTDKINRLLQISELEILDGFAAKNIFEVVGADDGRIYGGKVDISFKVSDNNSKVLSIRFDQSSCGATCAYGVRYYNFNSGNGDLIQLEDLFTEKGLKAFFAFATKRRIAQFKKELAKLKPSDKAGLDYITGCYENDDLTDYSIKADVLYIDGENCFSKNDKFYGIETVGRFNLSEFKTYLNAYGRSLFSVSRDSIKKYRSNVLPQLFQGKIANKGVLLVIKKGYENEVRAEYVYSKYGKGIFLEGTLDKDELTLTEKLPVSRESGFVDYVDNGFIKAKFDGENITGNWTNKDGTKTYALQMKRK